MKHAIRLGLVAAVFAFCGQTSAAADWKPDGNVEFVIGTSPGGLNDRIGRALVLGLTQNNMVGGANMTAINKPGGGQAIAAAYVQSHPGDPNYLVLLSGSWLANQVAKGNEDVLKGLTPLLKFMSAYNCFTVKSDSEIGSMADVKAALAKDAKAVSFAFATGAGNPIHIAIANVGKAAGVKPADMNAIVFKAGNEASAQVAGGHVDIGVSSMGSALPLVEGGKLRFIGCGSPQRLGGAVADVPTLKEQGIDVIAEVGYVVHAPAGISEDQRAFWEDALTRAVASKQFQEAAKRESWAIDLVPSRDVKAYYDNEYRSAKEALTELGLLK